VDLSGTSHANYLVIKTYKLAEQTGRYAPKPTREEYGSTTDAIIRTSPSLSGPIIKIFMVYSLDNPIRLQFTTSCFGHPHDGYGKQVETVIARSALAMVYVSLHFLHM
jgi:hypothetical protein